MVRLSHEPSVKPKVLSGALAAPCGESRIASLNRASAIPVSPISVAGSKLIEPRLSLGPGEEGGGEGAVRMAGDDRAGRIGAVARHVRHEIGELIEEEADVGDPVQRRGGIVEREGICNRGRIGS